MFAFKHLCFSKGNQAIASTIKDILIIRVMFGNFAKIGRAAGATLHEHCIIVLSDY